MIEVGVENVRGASLHPDGAQGIGPAGLRPQQRPVKIQGFFLPVPAGAFHAGSGKAGREADFPDIFGKSEKHFARFHLLCALKGHGEAGRQINIPVYGPAVHPPVADELFSFRFQ